jgi:omega-hydroxy-beta-dihydromenaquinone-9 sulfotransferase
LGTALSRRSRFNLTAVAWRRLRRNWDLPLSPQLLWQSYVAGPLFSTLELSQSALSASRRRNVALDGSVFILGYWRSGTTLLHEYLCADRRFGFPSTYACLNPHHFVLTQSAALSGQARTQQRPMDSMRISAASPQEDEFALLAVGARSPYEALLAPSRLGAALALSDPRDLSAAEARQWREAFIGFLSGVALVEGGRPLILKSPPHGYRVATLRELIPESRFILMVRSPEEVYESAVHMWRSLFAIYAMETVPPEDDTRRALLEDRPRFEAKLVAGLSGLPENRLALVRYEELVRDPLTVIAGLYEQLRLGGFADVEPAIREAVKSRGGYTARNPSPPDYWMRELRTAWAPIFDRYRYPLK